MKQFKVTLVRRIDQVAVVTVDAENANEAVAKGITLQRIDWRNETTEDTYYRRVEEVLDMSKELNMTEEFGDYSAELNIEYDGDDLVSWCHISTTHKGRDYCSSIGVAESYGTLDGEDGDDIKIAASVVEEIHDWALENGY